MNELLISPARSTFGPDFLVSFMGPIHLQNHLPVTLQTECIILENFLFPPKLLFPGGNGLSTSLKSRSDLLGNPRYHKRVAVRMQMNWRALKNPLASAAEVEKGRMMDSTRLSAERFCSFYGCQWLMYFIFCFLYCRLSKHPQAGGMSPGTHFILPPGTASASCFALTA